MRPVIDQLGIFLNLKRHGLQQEEFVRVGPTYEKSIHIKTNGPILYIPSPNFTPIGVVPTVRLIKKRVTFIT